MSRELDTTSPARFQERAVRRFQLRPRSAVAAADTSCAGDIGKAALHEAQAVAGQGGVAPCESSDDLGQPARPFPGGPDLLGKGARQATEEPTNRCLFRAATEQASEALLQGGAFLAQCR